MKYKDKDGISYQLPESNKEFKCDFYTCAPLNIECKWYRILIFSSKHIHSGDLDIRCIHFN